MDEIESRRLLQIATGAACQAGARIVTCRDEFEVLSAEGKDLKSVADLVAEQTIFAMLDLTGIAVLSEETRNDAELLTQDLCWIVDPLDGTLNFTRGLPPFCVSIALWERGVPLLGVIYDPTAQLTYSGIVGLGTTLNSQSVSVSKTRTASQAILCTGFPSGRSYERQSLERFVSDVGQFKKLRLLGSAAMSLAHVAAGHVDAYREDDIWLWDVAAGLALVQAAGGEIQYGPWTHELKSHVYASNGSLEISRLLSKYSPWSKPVTS